ncbi:hypothetical protein [Nocardioides montaniterrae]
MKFRPIALVNALLLVVFGGFAAAAVVAQVRMNNLPSSLNAVGWPSDWNDMGDRATMLGQAACAIGCLALVCGLLGVVRRLALHLGALVVAISLTLTGCSLSVSHTSFGKSWQAIYDYYVDGITWRWVGRVGFSRWWYFVTDILVPLGVVVLLVWLVVVATGAGRRRPGSSSAAAVASAHGATVSAAIAHEDFRYAAPSDLQADTQADPAPGAEPALGGEPAPVEVEPAEAAPEVEPAEAEPTSVAEPAETDAVWFVTVQGADHGPYSLVQLRGYLDEGRLHEGTITHLSGEPDQALADVLA